MRDLDRCGYIFFFFFFQAEDGIRDVAVTGVQTCALPIFTTASFASAAKAPFSSAISRTSSISSSVSSGKRLTATTASSPNSRTIPRWRRSEEHTSELQSRLHLVCRLLLEKKKKRTQQHAH